MCRRRRQNFFSPWITVSCVKGQGTVLTGTVLSGSCKVGDFVEIPHLKEEKKIKSMQIFRESTDECERGDRVGMSSAGLDPEGLERFLVSSPKRYHVRPSYRELRESSIAQEPGENKSKVPRDNWPSNSHGKS